MGTSARRLANNVGRKLKEAVLYKDNHLIAVNKWSGLICQGVDANSRRNAQYLQPKGNLPFRWLLVCVRVHVCACVHVCVCVRVVRERTRQLHTL